MVWLTASDLSAVGAGWNRGDGCLAGLAQQRRWRLWKVSGHGDDHSKISIYGKCPLALRFSAFR